MKFIYQPKIILLVLSLLLILWGLLTGRTIEDIHLHDTMFVIDHLSMGLFFGGLFILETIIYFLTDNYRQWRSIQYFHVISIGLIVLVGIGWSLFPPGPAPEPFQYSNYDRFQLKELMQGVLLMLFVLGQLLFIVNLVAGFIRGRKRI